jgi:hypothetical protein
MKCYSLTNEAEKQYREGSKRCQRMKFRREIIERRLNAMISISKDIFYFSDCDFEAGIFSCIITVKDNQISGKRWCNESHYSKTNRKSVKSLKEAYQKYGLNKCGERIVELVS